MRTEPIRSSLWRMVVVVMMFVAPRTHGQAPLIHDQLFFGGGARDEATALAHTDDGGVVIAGASRSTDGQVSGHHGDARSTDYWVVKLDHAGVMQWQRSLGGSNYDEAAAVVELADGGIVVAGESRSNDGDCIDHHNGTEFADAWVVKLDRNGNVLWQRSLGGSDYDAALAAAAVSDGGVIIAGVSNSNDGDLSAHHDGAEYGDGWLVRLSADGAILWQNSYGGAWGDEVHAVTQAHDGGFLCAGLSSSSDGDVASNNGADDMWIFKVDANGKMVWSRNAGGSANDGGTAIEERANGTVVAAGYSYSADGDVHGHHGFSEYSDAWIVTLSSTGTITGEHSYGGSRSDVATAIVSLGANTIVAGWSESRDGDALDHHGPATSDAWVFSIGPSGDVAWEKSIGGNDQDRATGVVPAEDGSLIVTGWMRSGADEIGRQGDADYFAAYCDAPRPTQPAASVAHLDVFPNPFTSTASVRIPPEVQLSQEMALVVSDLAGREVRRTNDINAPEFTIAREYLRAGTYVLKLLRDGVVVAEGRGVIQ